MKKSSCIFLFFLTFIKLEAQTWSLVWSDEFNAATIYPANWNFEIGNGNAGWGNNNLEYDTNLPNNVTAKNGNLLIIAKKETYNGKNYTSARINTRGLHNLTYGRVEARIKLPMQKGLWPAFWMLGENITQVGWPQCGEIDIMEYVNKDTVVNGTIHWDNNGHAQYGTETDCDVSQFHDYSIEWDQNTIKWLLDGNVYWTANIQNNINSTNEFHNPFFVILNLAVGGTWPGSPDGTSVFPDTMSVEYVRFYQLTSSISHVTLITTSGPVTICQGDSVILTANEAASYLWSTNDTTRSIVVKSAGSYSVNIIDSLGNNSYSTSSIVTVNALPATPTIAVNGNVFTSSSVSGNQWYLNGGQLSNATLQDHTATQDGDYLVMVTNSSNCSATSAPYSFSVTPVVVIPPTPVITANGSLTLCQGDSVTLSCSSANSYLWSNSETTQSIIVKKSGIYTVSIDGGAAVSDSVVVTVNNFPTVGVTVSPLVATVCEGENVILSGTGATTYLWSGGVTDGTPFIPPTIGAKTYTVTGISNACTNTSTQVITVITCIGGIGINETSASVQEIIIIPNPNNGLFSIQTKSILYSKIKIYNMYGEIVYESLHPTYEIDLSNEAQGTYFIEIFTQDKIVRKKLIIQ